MSAPNLHTSISKAKLLKSDSQVPLCVASKIYITLIMASFVELYGV